MNYLSYFYEIITYIMIRINYIINKLLIYYKKNDRFPDVHQEEPVSKHDTTFLQSTRNIRTPHVSQNNMET